VEINQERDVAVHPARASGRNERPASADVMEAPPRIDAYARRQLTFEERMELPASAQKANYSVSR